MPESTTAQVMSRADRSNTRCAASALTVRRDTNTACSALRLSVIDQIGPFAGALVRRPRAERDAGSATAEAISFARAAISAASSGSGGGVGHLQQRQQLRPVDHAPGTQAAIHLADLF
ncbi:MAG: hypothetical protein H6R11_1029, partial [Proteobacteria bacterium]|nr:hypothetical protein [Pseudomonadota bacterium]